MHNSMPKSHEMVLVTVSAQEFDKVINCPFVAQDGPFGPLVCTNGVARSILRYETRRCVEAFQLPAKFEFHVFMSIAKDRKLDTRRACVHNQDYIVHDVTLPFPCGLHGGTSLLVPPPHTRRVSSSRNRRGWSG